MSNRALSKIVNTDKLVEQNVDGSAIGEVNDDFLKEEMGIAKKPHRVLFLKFIEKHKGQMIDLEPAIPNKLEPDVPKEPEEVPQPIVKEVPDVDSEDN